MIRRYFSSLALIILGLGSLPHVSLAYEETQIDGSVDVTGQVIFNGSIPKPKVNQVIRDQAFCGDSVQENTLLIDGNSKGVANVIINVHEISTGKAFSSTAPLKINNKKCQFEPPVLLGTNGSILEIQSSDPILHNTHILRNDQTFLNVALPPGGRTIRKKISQPGRLTVRCDAHEFMKASIHIFKHPYFTSTDANGNFSLTNVPPGKYTLEIWHQTLGMKEISITVNKGAPLTLKVSYP